MYKLFFWDGEYKIVPSFLDKKTPVLFTVHVQYKKKNKIKTFRIAFASIALLRSSLQLSKLICVNDENYRLNSSLKCISNHPLYHIRRACADVEKTIYCTELNWIFMATCALCNCRDIIATCKRLIQLSFSRRLEKKRKILNMEYWSDLFLILILILILIALVGDVLYIR